jgi:hypothetical protein
VGLVALLQVVFSTLLVEQVRVRYLLTLVSFLHLVALAVQVHWAGRGAVLTILLGVMLHPIRVRVVAVEALRARPLLFYLVVAALLAVLLGTSLLHRLRLILMLSALVGLALLLALTVLQAATVQLASSS